jgi:hypothetical protein
MTSAPTRPGLFDAELAELLDLLQDADSARAAEATAA